MIPYGKQDISQADIDAVVSVLKSDFLTQGPQVPLFEKTLATRSGANYAIAVNSATSALHIACMALGLGAGDWLWTSPITFVASANVALYCGARVDFVDIDPQTHNMCPRELERKLTDASKEGRLPKILIPVHMAGQSCEMKVIRLLCNRFGVKIIEDASHAVGGAYEGRPVGSCSYSDITVFSFHPVKIITSAEGGAALTNDQNLYEKMALYRSHGVTRDQNKMTASAHGDWYYQQILLGYNYRMTDLQAALGNAQITRLVEFVEARHRIAQRYNELLCDLPLTTPFVNSNVRSAFHLFIICLELNQLAKGRKEIFEFLRASGIGVNVHYIPVHLQPVYQRMGFKEGDFPKAEQYYNCAISLPMYPGLSVDDQDHVVESLRCAVVSA